MQDGAAQGRSDGPEGCASGGLAHILLNSYQERLLQSRLEEEQEKEDGAKEEEEEDDERKDDEDLNGKYVTLTHAVQRAIKLQTRYHDTKTYAIKIPCGKNNKFSIFFFIYIFV